MLKNQETLGAMKRDLANLKARRHACLSNGDLKSVRSIDKDIFYIKQDLKYFLAHGRATIGQLMFSAANSRKLRRAF